MPRVTAFVGREVRGSDGRSLGCVSAVLFHPEGARVAGVQVDPGAVLGVIDRPPRFVLLGLLSAAEGGMSFTIPLADLPKDSAGERVLGVSWHETVIWQRMPVRSESCEEVGHVQDVFFDAVTGDVSKVRITTGAIGDAAVGKLEVPGELIVGFLGDAVVVKPGYGEIRSDGGAAKALATGAAAVKVRAGQVGEGALQVGVAASRALGRSLRSGVARKAIDKVKALGDEDE
ncbi:MAG: PRC-barrel domain containing protein [Actinobacteria bacterium]|nr:PRC-barrel domain containing protein [Actinomycetota bacterium]